MNGVGTIRKITLLRGSGLQPCASTCRELMDGTAALSAKALVSAELVVLRAVERERLTVRHRRRSNDSTEGTK